MQPLLHAVGPASALAADLLVGSVWRGLVLVVCVALLLRCLPRLSAAARSVVWTAVLLLVLLLPVYSLRSPVGGVAAKSFLQAGAAWSLGIAGVWLALSLLRLAQLAASAMRLRELARRAVPVQPGAEVDALLRQRSRQVQLCVSQDVSRPSVAGFFRPRILLPAGLLEELSAPELQHVVLHEMEHLRRRDDWTNLLQKVSLALLPLHPALLWLDRRLCLERELACDDRVLRTTHAPKMYAACLARLAEDSMVRRGLSLALGLLGVRARRSGNSELSGRVQRILRSPGAAMGRAQLAGATAVLLCTVLGGSMLLARTPRLISFGSGQPGAAAARTAGLEASAPAAPGTMGRDLMGKDGMGKEVMVRAVMGQPAARLTRTVTAYSRKPHPVRRVAVVPVPKAPSAPYLVFTEWRGGAAAAHMTLAIAQDTVQAPPSFQVPQPTYAAVPVRGGWLLIQL